MIQSTTAPGAASTLADAIRAAIHAALNGIRRVKRYHHDCTGDRYRADYAVGVAALADLLEESGDAEGAAEVRAGYWQEAREGKRVVTVGRYGSRTAGTGGGCSVGVWTTKIYMATRRRDGLLTWRLLVEIDAHSTSGRKATGPMVARAKAAAAERGIEYVGSCLHGEVCR